MRKYIFALLLLLPPFYAFSEEPVLTSKYAIETPTFTATAANTVKNDFMAATATAVITGEVKTVEETAASPSPTAVVLLPENINIDNTDMYSVKLSWVPAGDPANIWYDILRRISNETDYVTLNENRLRHVNEYKDTTIKPGEAYYYMVAAYDDRGNTTVSKELYIKTAQVYPPGKPGNFRVLQDIESVSLRWESSMKGTHEIKGYRIYKGSAPGAEVFYKELDPSRKNLEDNDVKPGYKYFYKLSVYDEKGNETYADANPASIAYPKPMTGLILMPSAYRNNIFDNNGLNVDMSFSYYIGSIAGEHDIYPYGKDSDAFEKIGVWLLTGDAKYTLFNEKDTMPSLGIGAMYTFLLQDKIGASSEKTGVGVKISGKNDSLSKYFGTYINSSREIAWGIHGYAGYIFGGSVSYLNYLTEFLPTRTGTDGKTQVEYPNSYYLGISFPIFVKIGMKAEYIVPGLRRNPLLPDIYLINTHIDRLLNFNFSFFKYPGGYSWLGYFSFRFSIFPNPYKVDGK